MNCQFVLFELLHYYVRIVILFIRTVIYFLLPFLFDCHVVWTLILLCWTVLQTVTFFCSNCNIILFKLPLHFDWTVVLFCSHCHFILFELSFYFVWSVISFCLKCHFMVLLDFVRSHYFVRNVILFVWSVSLYYLNCYIIMFKLLFYFIRIIRRDYLIYYFRLVVYILQT